MYSYSRLLPGRVTPGSVAGQRMERLEFDVIEGERLQRQMLGTGWSSCAGQTITIMDTVHVAAPSTHDLQKYQNGKSVERMRGWGMPVEASAPVPPYDQGAVRSPVCLILSVYNEPGTAPGTRNTIVIKSKSLVLMKLHANWGRQTVNTKKHHG